MQDKYLVTRLTPKCYCEEIDSYTEMQTSEILPCKPVTWSSWSLRCKNYLVNKLSVQMLRENLAGIHSWLCIFSILLADANNMSQNW
jgi:hypothetical protein